MGTHLGDKGVLAQAAAAAGGHGALALPARDAAEVARGQVVDGDGVAVRDDGDGGGHVVDVIREREREPAARAAALLDRETRGAGCTRARG